MFAKLIPVLVAPPDVVKSRVDIQVQTAKREAETTDTETVNQQIISRYQLFSEGRKDANGKVLIPATPKDEIPTLSEIRMMIIQENLEHDNKLQQVINQGGLNVAQIRQ